jgi:hypothetical protein
MKYNSLKVLSIALLISSLFFFSCDEKTDTPLPYNNLGDFFAGKAPQTQTFTVDPATTQTITGNQGTQVTFSANSFVDAQGVAVTGSVTVELKEIFSKGDMIWSDRMTTSNNQLLESGGELYLKATSGGQEVFMNQNYLMNVPIKSATSNPFAMQLFEGQTVADTFSWTPVDSTWVGVDTINNNYNVYFDSLKWINCDYFYNSGTLSTVNAEPTGHGVTLTDVRAFMVFTNINSVAPMNASGNLFTSGSSYSAPVGEAVTIVIIGMDGTQFFLGTVSTTVTNANTISVPMSAVSETQLQAAIDAL